MKHMILIVCLLTSLKAFSQKPQSQAAVTNQVTVLDITPAGSKQNKFIGIKKGDTVTISKYNQDKNEWIGAYKGQAGTISNDDIEESESILAFKKSFERTPIQNYALWVKWFGVKYAKDIKKSEVEIGMPAAAFQIVFGRPSEINRSVYTFGTNEQWVYRNNEKIEYYYFVNGKLKSWQD